MVSERNGRLIEVGLLSADPKRHRLLAGELESSGSLRLVLRAAELREIGPRRPEPDVFLWDLFDREFPGVGYLEELLDRLPGEPALLVIGDSPAVAAALVDLSRPWGWVQEDSSPDRIGDAIRAVDAGFVTLDFDFGPELPFYAEPDRRAARRIAGAGRTGSDGADVTRGDARAPVSDREGEVLSLIFGGYHNRQIAEILGVSENTVKYHVASLYEKLGVGSRAEAIREAMRRGMLAL